MATDSTFDTALQGFARSAVTGILSKDVSYSDDGAVTVIQGAWEGRESTIDESRQGERQTDGGTLRISREDVANPVPYKDSVTVDGRTYKIVGIKHQDAAFTELECLVTDTEQRHSEAYYAE